MALNLKMWKDILTEKIGTGEKLYSQARVYLLFSVIAYYLILGLVTIKSLKPTLTIEMDSIKTIIDALQWFILLFAGYSFGHKGIEAAKTIFGKSPQIDNDAPDTSNIIDNTINNAVPPSTTVSTTIVSTETPPTTQQSP
jgi:hypothetical protein